MEVHFELLEEKNPLISVDLKPQNSYELSRKYGVIENTVLALNKCIAFFSTLMLNTK
jgi:hypothetical protein